MAFFLIAAELGPARRAVRVLSFVVLAVLGQYAVYRARRYRLTRTVYRGVRFHQSRLGLALCRLRHVLVELMILTLGLAYPFAQASLERFKMRNTYYGNLPGRFEGSGLQLFLRGILMWFLAVVPFVAGLLATLGAVDWDALAEAAGGGDDMLGWIEATRACQCGRLSRCVDADLAAAFAGDSLSHVPGDDAALVGIGAALRRSRGDVAAAHRAGLRRLSAFPLATRSCSRSSWRRWSDRGRLRGSERAQGRRTFDLSEIIATVALVAAYVVAALGYSTIYQATVKLGLWRCVAELLDISGAERSNG